MIEKTLGEKLPEPSIILLGRNHRRESALKKAADLPQGLNTGDTRSEFWNAVLGVERDLPLDHFFFQPGRHSRPGAEMRLSGHRPIRMKLRLQP